jgi:hypothetical protein
MGVTLGVLHLFAERFGHRLISYMLQTLGCLVEMACRNT